MAPPRPPKPPGPPQGRPTGRPTGPGRRPGRGKRPDAPAFSGLPDEATLIAFLREAGEADRGDVARAFGLKGLERRALRDMIRKLEDAGKLGRRGRKGVAEAGSLPPVGVADVVERDGDGDLWVRLTRAGEDAP